MKYLTACAGFAAVAITAASLILPSPGAASESCNVPREQWQPEAALRERLESQGWQIHRIKIDEGCYEVYGLDKDGQRREVYFDPRTLEPVAGD